jgi:hypothetical protein
MKNERALDRPDDHNEVAALWRDSLGAFHISLPY